MAAYVMVLIALLPGSWTPPLFYMDKLYYLHPPPFLYAAFRMPSPCLRAATNMAVNAASDGSIACSYGAQLNLKTVPGRRIRASHILFILHQT
jgi:hypothetical protein